MKVKLQALWENYCLNIESEVHDVAILHHVLAAFKTEFTSLFDGIFRTELNQIRVMINLGPDEPFFKIRVDLACLSLIHI